LGRAADRDRHGHCRRRRRVRRPQSSVLRRRQQRGRGAQLRRSAASGGGDVGPGFVDDGGLRPPVGHVAAEPGRRNDADGGGRVAGRGELARRLPVDPPRRAGGRVMGRRGGDHFRRQRDHRGGLADHSRRPGLPRRQDDPGERAGPGRRPAGWGQLCRGARCGVRRSRRRQRQGSAWRADVRLSRRAAGSRLGRQQRRQRRPRRRRGRRDPNDGGRASPTRRGDLRRRTERLQRRRRRRLGRLDLVDGELAGRAGQRVGQWRRGEHDLRRRRGRRAGANRDDPGQLPARLEHSCRRGNGAQRWTGRHDLG